MTLEYICEQIFCPKKIYSYSEIYLNRNLLTGKEGLYGWYFKPESFSDSDSNKFTKNCHVHENKVLLYVGHTTDLNKRIVSNHYKGNASISTLRKTLGVLFGSELERFLSGSKEKFKLPDENEKKLDVWLEKNAFVTWIELPNSRMYEEQIFQQTVLPFNIKSNPNNDFAKGLIAMRKQAKMEARRKAQRYTR